MANIKENYDKRISVWTTEDDRRKLSILASIEDKPMMEVVRELIRKEYARKVQANGSA